MKGGVLCNLCSKETGTPEVGCFFIELWTKRFICLYICLYRKKSGGGSSGGCGDRPQPIEGITLFLFSACKLLNS